MLSELLHADDLDLMSETIGGLRNKLIEWMKSYKCMGLFMNLGKTKVVNGINQGFSHVNGSITNDGLSKSEFDPCGVCSLRVKDNSVLCAQCGKWIYGTCAGVKRLTYKFSMNFASRKCYGNIGDAVEQEEML